MKLLARTLAPLSIDYQLACRQELIDHLYGNVHVATTVASQVNDELLHALHVEVGQSNKHLGVGLFAKVFDVDVAGLVIIHHIEGIDTHHRNVATYDGKVL